MMLRLTRSLINRRRISTFSTLILFSLQHLIHWILVVIIRIFKIPYRTSWSRTFYKASHPFILCSRRARTNQTSIILFSVLFMVRRQVHIGSLTAYIFWLGVSIFHHFTLRTEIINTLNTLCHKLTTRIPKQNQKCILQWTIPNRNSKIARGSWISYPCRLRSSIKDLVFFHHQHQYQHWIGPLLPLPPPPGLCNSANQNHFLRCRQKSLAIATSTLILRQPCLWCPKHSTSWNRSSLVTILPIPWTANSGIP